MVYILSIFFCVVLSIIYDIKGARSNKHFWYNLLLLWFILVSGLQYYVGIDIFEYVRAYKNFNPGTFHFSDFDYYMNNQKQPGWIMLTYLCKMITDDFIIIKIIQAVFINVAFFSFFKRETKYIFLCVLIYALLSYLVLNFNVYRHSIALGFALYGFSCLRRKEFLKYYVFVLLAWLFHNSALILLVFPLFHFIKYNRWTLIILIVFFLSILGFFNSDNLTNLLFTIIEKGYIGEDLSTLGSKYMSSERQGAHDTFAVFSIRRLLIMIVLVYYIYRKKDLFIGSFGLFYLFFCILAGFMQALWRFRLYVDPFYYIILSTVIVELPQHLTKTRIRLKQKTLAYALALCLLLYLPIRDYLASMPNSKWRGIDQYYPYHSIFDPVIDREQKNYFENL